MKKILLVLAIVLSGKTAYGQVSAITSGGPATHVVCDSGCVAGGGVSDTDDNSVNPNQLSGLNLAIGYGYDGTAGIWKRIHLFALVNANAQAVAIVDASGNQITSFGGGTQYVNGVANGGPTGTLSLGYDGANLRGLKTDNTGQLNVIGTFFQATQPVSGTFWQATQPVSGTFFQATQPVSIAGNQAVNLAQLVGTATSVNSGIKDNGTLRVVLATDQPQLTNKLLVTPDSVALPANQSVNVNQFGGSAVVTGLGVSGSGIPRVTVSSDTVHSVNNNDGSGNSLPSSVAAFAGGERGLNTRPILEQRVGSTGTLSAVNAALTGTASANSAVEVSIDGMGADGIFVIPATSTLVSTLLCQYTLDGSVWATTICLETSTGSRKVITIATITLTGYTIEVIGPASAKKVRITVAAFTSGTTGATVIGYASNYTGPFAIGTLSGQREGDSVSVFTSSGYPQLAGGQDASAAARMLRLTNVSPTNTEYGLVERTLPTPTTLIVTALSGANAGVTATLPAVGSSFHYITAIQIVRSCTTALVGTALLAYTTTNLPGSLAFSSGNACGVGTTNEDLNMVFPNPLKSSVANTNTTIVAPAGGAAVIIRINVFYYTGS